MMFILRAVFWLSVVSALMPAREQEPVSLHDAAGQIAGAAVDYCRQNAQTCAATAGLGVQALRIPADFILQTQKSLPAPSRQPASL